MTQLADKRRATRLMKDARTQALDLIDADEYAAKHIAMRSFVFVEEAARLSGRDYAPAEAARVLARFRDRWAELATVTEAD
jgi:hypothetical protein